MKKLIALALAASAFTFAITGCGGTGNTNNMQNSANSSQTSQENTQNNQNSEDNQTSVTIAESNALENGNNGENGRILDHDGIIGNNESTSETSNNMFGGVGDAIEDGADRLATAASDVLM